jgi:hypothetical protein
MGFSFFVTATYDKAERRTWKTTRRRGCNIADEAARGLSPMVPSHELWFANLASNLAGLCDRS